ncbi:MAG: adenylate kinase [Melioribacteraceae bacterium]|nr:adenylate kinase [Melioribacteraceae bacterium]MCF8354859.1 adenylate kinase [Melioribacteraceae bacterium]MCF8392966.1 adenylate kinase [Melioribacteraceae bacterium]MCF8417291.1 adenylate kinase [Melioribacteraceae bacterium]
MQIIIFGSPGVGKGTQAKILASKLDIPHISTGDILREAIKNETEIGNKAKEIVERGELVPDQIMGEIVKEVLESERCKNGFILDGFPRTTDQAKILDGILMNLDREKPCLVKLEADDSIIIDRLTSRRTCNVCNNIINLKELDDKNKCPHCGAVDSFVKRKDDTEEVIKKRLVVYHETTETMFDYYQDKANLLEVDGAQSIENVAEEVLTKLSDCRND